MSNTYDIVAMGAGHNGLTAAAYLAKAGKKVLLLERNPYPGGGVVTRELNTPGYWHDVHSSVHIMLQGNPLITHDELGLLGEHGLKYKYSDVPHATIFPDQETIITYQDLDKTCESIARYSSEDAESYRRFVTLSKKMLPMFLPGLYTPPPSLGQLVAMLDSNEEGQMVLDYMQRSSLDIITKWFKHERVQMHILRMIAENLQLPDELGTGMGALLMPGILHTYGVSQPFGGSGKLTESLVRCVESYGGEVRVNSEVKRIIIKDGKAVGVEMSDGEKIMAKDAVIGSMHPHKLRQFVEGVDEPVLQRAENASLAAFSLFVCHYDLKKPVEYRAADKNVEKAIMLSLCNTDSMHEMQAEYDALKRGEVNKKHRFMSGNDESLSDPSRVPPGCGMWHSTGFVPYELAEGGSARWDEFKEQYGEEQQQGFQRFLKNLTPDNIVARRFESPLDLERSSPNSMVGGDVHGLAPYFYQTVGSRPTPDLGQFKVPKIDSMYLVGPFMHPGGGVFGAGRATAMTMFDDLGMDFRQTVNQSAGPDTIAPPKREPAPKDGQMHMYDDTDSEIMAVSSIKTEGNDLVIKGKSFGSMPMVARLTPDQARVGMKLVGFKDSFKVAKWFLGFGKKDKK